MLGAVVYAIGGFIEMLIGLRFVLRLLGANPESGFVNWVYDWSTPFVAPFSNIFGQEATIITDHGVVTNSVFDWTALIAFFVIGLITSLLARAFRL